MQPDEVLAAQALDLSIQTAGADPSTDPEYLTLLQFQRSLVGMSPDDARMTAVSFARQSGKHASFGNNGDGTLPSIHGEVNRDFLVPQLANAERWRIVGINPNELYGTDAYGNAHRQDMEDSWREARSARQALVDAQTREAAAMERITHPAAFVPRDSAQ